MDGPHKSIQNAAMAHFPAPARARFLLLLLLAALLQGSSCSWAFESGHDDDDAGDTDGGTIGTMEQATFGGARLAGELAGLPGLISARAGWKGNGPFLGAWLAHWTGHVRVTRVRFDPARLPLPILLAEVHARRAAQGASRVTLHARSPSQQREARATWPAGAPVLAIRSAR